MLEPYVPPEHGSGVSGGSAARAQAVSDDSSGQAAFAHRDSIVDVLEKNLSDENPADKK
jgi:hypothetical protein